MSRMSSHLELKSHIIGGVLQGLIRKFFGGQSLFVGEYTASQLGFVALSPSFPGCVLHRRLENEPLMLTAGSFLACTRGVQIKPRFGGLKAVFSSEGVVLLEISGPGELFFNAYGAVVEREIDGSLTVDTGHVVAWEPTLDYTIGGMGGLKQTLFSGEGLVMNFSGRGKLWLQTRHLRGVAGWLAPYCRG